MAFSEDIITLLSRFSDLTVVSRQSSFAYKGKDVDVRQIGKELGVTYVLEGSAQRKGDKVRITAQLIDARTNGHVWADGYENEGSDPWVLHDEVTEKVVASLTSERGQIKKKEYEQAWGRDSAHLEEYDYYLRGHEYFFRFTKEDMATARRIWQEGLTKFPDSSLLRMKLGWGYFQNWYQGWGETGSEDLHRAYKLVKEALADPRATPFTQHRGHHLLAFLHTYFTQDVGGALTEAKAARALGPYDVATLADLPEIF